MEPHQGHVGRASHVTMKESIHASAGSVELAHPVGEAEPSTRLHGARAGAVHLPIQLRDGLALRQQGAHTTLVHLEVEAGHGDIVPVPFPTAGTWSFGAGITDLPCPGD